MKTRIDIEQWERKDHFEFFNGFDEPYYGITVAVDCTATYLACKGTSRSFYLSYLHKSLTAANSVKAFRYRILDGQVYLFDRIHASPTVPREGKPFGFSYVDYNPDYERFAQAAREEIQRVQATSGLDPASSGQDVIHYSSLPWLKFTALSHARHYGYPDSSPKISFGKVYLENGRWWMPMSVHVHHALADGEDVGSYVAAFEALLEQA